MMSSSLFCLFLFLFLHACNARPISLRDKQQTHKHIFLSGKGVRSSTVEKIKEQEKILVKMDESIIHESRLEKENVVPIQRNSKALENKEEDNKGNKDMKTSLQALQEKGEIWKKQVRSTLQTMRHDAEETLNSKEDDMPEDVVAMDYAQPQRKPPIHNKQQRP